MIRPRAVFRWLPRLASRSALAGLGGLACLCLAAVGCAAATPPEAAAAENASPGKADAHPAEEAREPAAASLAPGVKGSKPKDTVPDDYQLTDVDCDQLGIQFGVVTKSDLMVQLSPKLAAAVRNKAEGDIDKTAQKHGGAFADGCRKNVGKVVDPSSLKCAINAGSVKAFDQCMNGVAAPAK